MRRCLSKHVLFATALILAAASNQAIAGPDDPSRSGPAADSKGARLLAEPLNFPPVDPTIWHRAHITVLLPDPDTQLQIDGNRMFSTGITREFVSPPLDPGQSTYVIRANWTVDGTPVTHFRTVEVSPGSHAVVNFQPNQQ
jgi:uncharacterized protein (TIGR03000 family)